MSGGNFVVVHRRLKLSRVYFTKKFYFMFFFSFYLISGYHCWSEIFGMFKNVGWGVGFINDDIKKSGFPCVSHLVKPGVMFFELRKATEK